MINKFNNLIGKFDELPIRIRLLLTFAGVLIIGFIADLVWISANFEKNKRLQSEIIQTDQIIDQLIVSQEEINASIINQRHHPLHKQLQQIQKSIADIKSQLEAKTINLVKPEVMTDVLREVIDRSKELRLLSLIKQPPQELFNVNGQQTNDKQDNKQNNELDNNQQQIQMYRHPVKLILEGNYADTQFFLKQLEDMPQKINFESLEYIVDKYPVSKITLVVSTLSLNRKWIGG